MPQFIFLVKKQIPSISLYFERGNRYLQPARPQIYVALYILG